MKALQRKIIGRREMISLPELQLFDIEAKIDTGAYTSSIHCRDIKPITKNNVAHISFILLDPEHPLYEEKLIEWPLYKMKTVKNSFGQVERRAVIKTRISFYDEDFETEISLADRSEMEYPVLLGRKALKKRFVVDVLKVNYAQKRKICKIE